MEFWGIEVKSGQSLKVESELDKLLHLSHATLGESKTGKANESVFLSLKIDDQKLALGTLSHGNTPQLNFDLVFERDFELSHNWKNGSVFFTGYKSIIQDEDESDDELESEDDAPLHLENGNLETKVDSVKPSAIKFDKKPESSEKPKAKVEQPPEKEKPKEEDDDDEYSSDDVDDADEVDEEMVDGEEDSSDEDGEEEDSSDDEEEDEETPKKAEPSKKRSTDSATKTPVAAKKAKFSSPQMTDGKKGGHVDTPHPSKKVGNTPAENKKLSGNKNDQTPTSSSAKVSCNSCSKTFNSEKALQDHSKAKHSAK